MPKKVKIRVAVVVDEKGKWSAAGEFGQRQADAIEASHYELSFFDNLGTSRRAYILTATIEAAVKPKPEVVVAQAEETP